MCQFYGIIERVKFVCVRACVCVHVCENHHEILVKAFSV
jgi:hypothetical protein